MDYNFKYSDWRKSENIRKYEVPQEANRKSKCYGGLEFLEFEKNEKKYNQEYDEVFVFVFQYAVNTNKKQKFSTFLKI